jgi:hypothetical protein
MGKAQVGSGTPENPQYPARPEVKGFSSLEKSQGDKVGSLLP